MKLSCEDSFDRQSFRTLNRESVAESLSPVVEQLLKFQPDESCSVITGACEFPVEELLANPPQQPQNDPFEVTSVFHDLKQASILPEATRLRSSPADAATLKAAKQSVDSLDDLQATITRVGRRQAALKTLPDIGDVVFGFRLKRELGKGAFARVFLAEQAELGDRPVVLKLSPIEGTEPQTLAQMQHTHIVPIYSVHEDPVAGLRAVCMPFLGVASLSQVLKELWNHTPKPMHGHELVEALQRFEAQALPPAELTAKSADKDSAAEHDADVSEQTPLQKLRSMTYLQACVWLVARLAEGLAHAHDRHILHRDVKPSNVLLTSDGQPLLLDFNLSHDQQDAAAEATVGGTISYMAPEHLQALLTRSKEAARRVDHRSDLYSLGMLLFEMLTGHRPFDQSGSYSAMLVQIKAMVAERSQVVPSLKAQCPEVSWTLESILRKCLAPNPDDRYQQAQHLLEDLQRFLEDRPLRFAPELSWLEQARKWTRRHPRLTYAGSIGSLATMALLVVGTALHSVHGHLTKTRAELHSIQAKDQRAAFNAGTVKALCLVNTTIPLADHLREGVAVCEKTLNLYGFLQADGWREPEDWKGISAAERRRLAEDTRELLMLLAGARVQLHSDDPAAYREALALLDRAESIPHLEPSKALWLDRARYWQQLGDSERASAAERTAEQLVAKTARDRYLLATTYARAGGRDGYVKALRELNEAIRLDPRHYWSWTQRGFCHFELGDHLVAAADFGHCTGLWPEFAWGYFNRACVLDKCGKKQEAIDDYTAAIQRDPNFAAAYANRGLALLELRRFADALADFEVARSFGKADAAFLASHAMALEGVGRHADADTTFAAALSSVGHLNSAERLPILWAYGFSVSSRLPEEARRAFQQVLAEQSDNQQALYGMAMLAMNDGENDVALEYFHRALEANPNFTDALRYRAILWARLGQFDRAGRDINLCLEREPTVAATLYAAACVASRMTERTADPLIATQALDLLQRAIDAGTDRSVAQTDPDLEAIRKHPRALELFPSDNSSR
jgi:serine/threonine protein kinase/tetratricopeptide (TPR) repeat protein